MAYLLQRIACVRVVPHAAHGLPRASSQVLVRQYSGVSRNCNRSTVMMLPVFRPDQYNSTSHAVQHKNPQIVFAACISAASVASYFKLPHTEWYSIPTLVGILFLCYIQYYKTRKREDKEQHKLANNPDVEVDDYIAYLYQCLPLRTVSKVFGYVSEKELPAPFLRRFLTGYCKYFEVDLDEACLDDLDSYKTIAEFFQRELKPSVRVIDNVNPLITPCDGKVLHNGRCVNGYVEQVKGIKYPIEKFLGSAPTLSDPVNNDLFYTVLYLAPGDYHLFHSPCQWTVKKAIHFPGTLMSVNPWVCKVVRGVFTLNERVMLAGEWEHGYFSYTAVGATGVGSIKINFLKELQTNKSGFLWSKDARDVALEPEKHLEPGDMIGGFNFGSTIVLMFEAPKEFQFTCQNGERVRMGAGLGQIRSALTLEEEISEVVADCAEQIVQTISDVADTFTDVAETFTDVAEQTELISNGIIKTAVELLEPEVEEIKTVICSEEIISNLESVECSKQ